MWYSNNNQASAYLQQESVNLRKQDQSFKWVSSKNSASLKSKKSWVLESLHGKKHYVVKYY